MGVISDSRVLVDIMSSVANNVYSAADEAEAGNEIKKRLKERKYNLYYLLKSTLPFPPLLIESGFPGKYTDAHVVATEKLKSVISSFRSVTQEDGFIDDIYDIYSKFVFNTESDASAIFEYYCCVFAQYMGVLDTSQGFSTVRPRFVFVDYDKQKQIFDAPFGDESSLDYSGVSVKYLQVMQSVHSVSDVREGKTFESFLKNYGRVFYDLFHVVVT